MALHQDAATVEVVVRDSGPGVAARSPTRSSPTASTKGRSGERGIGLALTRLVCQSAVARSPWSTEDGAMFTAHLTVAPVAESVS